MAGNALTTASVMMCPHGGSILAISSNARTRVQGAYVLRSTDAFTIAGCSFSTAAGPMPCLSVRWVAADTKASVLDGFTLSQGSVGLCMNAASAPQGTVQVTSTQANVSSV